MSSRTLLNLLLFTAVVVLGLLAYFEPGRTPAPPARPLTTLTPNAIDAIVIEREGQARLRLARHDGQWRLEAPLQGRANPYRVESILGLATAVSLAQFPAKDLDLRQLELDPPRIRVQLGPVSLAIGGTEALDYRRYVLLGDTVHLLADLHYPQLVANPVELLDPALLDPDARPTSIVLPGLSLRLVDSHWNLVPANPAVSADAVASLVERWRRARAMRLSTCPPKPDRAPPHWAEVGLAGVATPLRWEIRQDHAELVLCREDLRVAYHFTKETGATLLGVGATGPESGADAAGARD